eukprot:m.483877 g.483877  ORF g.483877 m.483877 type:complete len:588 (-) comp21729_c0_seq7:489-2252(-)
MMSKLIINGGMDKHSQEEVHPLLDSQTEVSATCSQATVHTQQARKRGQDEIDFMESLLPVPQTDRTWTTWTYVAMWIGCTVQPSSFVFGAALLGMGLSLFEGFLALTFGNFLLLGPLTLNSLPGVKYGIPFPVLCRASFGVRGASIAVAARGLVGIGWAGFNLWLGATAMYSFGTVVHPAMANTRALNSNLNAAQLACFIVFVVVHLASLLLGIRRLQLLLKYAPTIQLLGGFALLCWTFSVGSLHELYVASEQIKGSSSVPPVVRVLVGMTAACSGWSTLALNITDLSRYGTSARAVVRGQLFAFPIMNIVCPMVGMLAFAAGHKAYNSTVAAGDWTLTSLFQSWHPAASFFGAGTFVISIFTTNMVANILSAGNDVYSILPWVGFKGGASLAILAGCALQPWNTFASPSGFVNEFLLLYSMITGGLLGVMVVDYMYIRRQTLSLSHLYSGCSVTGGLANRRRQNHQGDRSVNANTDDDHVLRLADTSADECASSDDDFLPVGSRARDSQYFFCGGFNIVAFLAVVCGAVPCIPGFVNVVVRHEQDGVGGWTLVYDTAWMVSTALSGATYAAMTTIATYMRSRRAP